MVGHTSCHDLESQQLVRDGVTALVAAPHIALAQSAYELPIKELVVASNHLVQRELQARGLRFNISTAQRQAVLHEWRELCASHTHCRTGRRKLKRALALTTAGAESRMETLTWLFLAALGFEHFFEQQVAIFDDNGEIGRFDLVCERLKLIIEYDGEQHRTNREQYLRDQKRLARAQQAGCIVIRLTRDDLFSRKWATVARVSEALGCPIPAAPIFPELF